ncbi:MAG TPA: alkaline phosphatase family protein [Thermoanaerobaculia bacterium]|nr:alkaline phosphatase family protein [Thermoanaerobaculia bacterium]
MEKLSRRRFLVQSAVSVAALGAAPAFLSAIPRKMRLPNPQDSGIDHVIVLMMENRSFDHLLGWLAGGNGAQAGLVYTDTNGVAQATYPLAPDFQGCGHKDPDHSYEGGRIELNGGKCDGWLRADNDEFAIGYYVQADLPFLGQAAPEWTTFSRYFSPIMASTYPNRMYQHAGVTDRLDNSVALSSLPTIWDRLADAGRTGLYYASDAPFLALWGPKYVPITRSFDAFVDDCAAGTLPDVAFVDPPFIDSTNGTSSDDHPFSDIRAGESFMYRVYRAVTTSPAWERTVLFINFDEWGGFFETVAPDTAPDVDPRFQLRGFRVPALVVSPLARRGHVAHTLYDHTSILNMIEWRWGLDPLSRRDAKANNIAEVLDFSSAPNLAATDYMVPAFASPACP